DHIPEWHIAVAGLADLCVWLGDAASAAQLYRQLAPCAGLQAMLAHTPHEGPVALHLGRLADLMGDRGSGLAHLLDALRSSEQMNAQPSVAYCLAALAQHHGYQTAEGATYAQRAVQIARRLRMDPLATEIAERQRAECRTQPRLTRRELEIAGLVAEGHSNATIAKSLTLSERTVESHVSHILQKLGQSSRLGIALWHQRTTS
ncbi:MAG TPA: LuxR C-terminal-related transcriptional regulator, partial [Microlunatus sp.]